MEKILFTILFALSFNANAEWAFEKKVDPMTDEVRLITYSSDVRAVELLKSPYRETRSSLVVQCEKGKTYVYLWFSDAYLLGLSKLKEGVTLENNETVQFRFDNKKADTVSIYHDQGSNLVYFISAGHSEPLDTLVFSSWVDRIKKHKTLTVSLKFEDSLDHVFRYDLTGSAAAIAKMEAACAK